MTTDRYTLPIEPQPNQPPFHWPIAWAALTLHTLAVIGFAWMLYSDDRSDPEVIAIWILWCLPDFPSGVLALLFARFVTWSFHQHDFDTRNISLALHVGLLGGLQWFLVSGAWWGEKLSSQGTLVSQPESNTSLTEHVTPADRDNPYTAPNANLSRD